MTEKKTWKRPISLVRGPFQFFYEAYYESDRLEEYWNLVLFRSEGYKIVANFPINQKMELIKKFGRQAAKAAHMEAEKKYKVPIYPIKGMV